MSACDSKYQGILHPEMTVLEVVSRFRQTEAVFKRYDELVGECICCRSLFEPLQRVAEKYDLDLARLMRELESAGSEQ